MSNAIRNRETRLRVKFVLLNDNYEWRESELNQSPIGIRVPAIKLEVGAMRGNEHKHEVCVTWRHVSAARARASDSGQKATAPEL